MVWSKQKDLALLKEVAAEGVLIRKQRSREQGMQWQKVADNMSVMGQDITTRAVRDHYKMISKKYRARMAREERATDEGGAEDEMLLEELIDVEDETDRHMENETEAKNQRIENERGQALEMRERAMERIGKIWKRMGGTSESGGTVQKS
jgi:hypothetical protein